MAKLITADKLGLAKAVGVLRAGQLVALPTDTVYGLAAIASDKNAIAEIYAVKNRPAHKALSVVVFAPSHAKKLVRVSPLAQSLMDVFWPGALTLVLPVFASSNEASSSEASSDAKSAPTLAVRCPDIAWTQIFIDLGFVEPLVLPSANISGQAAPVTAAQVQAGLGSKIPLILDGGLCKTGQESTIIAVDGNRAKLLRRGAIAPERFAKFDMDLR